VVIVDGRLWGQCGVPANVDGQGQLGVVVGLCDGAGGGGGGDGCGQGCWKRRRRQQWRCEDRNCRRHRRAPSPPPTRTHLLPPSLKIPPPLLLRSPLSPLSSPSSVTSNSQSHCRFTGISNRYLFRGNPREDPDQICGDGWRRGRRRGGQRSQYPESPYKGAHSRCE
jgi:hypothetical protein